MRPALAALLAIGFSADPTAHFPRDNPDVAAWLALSQRFDAFNTLIVGLEEPDAPLAGIARVKQITDRLTALKASGVLAVASVTNVESVHEGADGLETELLVSGPAAALPAKIAADAQVSGVLISTDQRGYAIVIRADPRRDAVALAEAIRAVVEAERGPLTATYFGAPYFQQAPTRALRAQLWWLVPSLAVLLFGLLALTVRRAATIARVVLAAALSAALWLAVLWAVNFGLTPSSASVGLGVLVLGALAATRGFKAAAPGLGATGAGAAALMLFPSFWGFGAALALGAASVLLVTFLLARTAEDPAPAPPPLAWLLVALAVLGGVGATARYQVTPQTIFEEDGEAGRSLNFFDRRFGGPDFIQLDFRGDLRDPAVAARLLRLSDLLDFPDVRGVAPILGFLNQSFGGVHRIPTSRESLNNLWFFLEGRPDVRNLASDTRDEAMVLLRMPSKPDSPVAELRARVDAAVKASLEQGRAATKLRLAALAKRHALPPERIDAVLDAPEPDTRAAVAAALQRWLASGESPFQPTPEQWAKLAAALDAPEALAKVAAELGIEDAQPLVDSIVGRQKDLRLALHALARADALWPGAPAAVRTRAQGIFADHLDPHLGAGDAATITVTGLPMIAPQIERDSRFALFRALGLLLVLGGAVLFAVTRSPRPLVEAALASAAPLAVVGALGPGIDPGSAAIYLLIPGLAFVAHGASRVTAEVALAASATTALLAVTGVLPIARIGTALGVGLAAVAALQLLGRRATATARSRG